MYGSGDGPLNRWDAMSKLADLKPGDYDVLVGTNRHTITPTGWVQEENNLKLALNQKRFLAREYGVVAEIAADGSFEVRGVSDLQTNGAGTGTGYILGRPPDAARVRGLDAEAAGQARGVAIAGG